MITLAQADLGGSVEQAVGTVVAFVPKLVAFIVIVGVGWIVARVLERAVDRVLERVGFDRAVERGGVQRALSRTDYDASDLLAKLVFYAVMLFVLQLAFGVFGPNPISALLFGIIAFLPRIFVALVIVVLAAAIAAVVRDLIEAMVGSLSYGGMLANAAGAVILAIGVFAALDQVEIAPAIVNGVFIALLTVVVGVTVVAVGGGGIQPMRARWETALARLDDESGRIREQVAASAGDDVEDATRKVATDADAAVEDETASGPPTVPTSPPDAATPRGPRRSTSTLRSKLEDAGWPPSENDDR